MREAQKEMGDAKKEESIQKMRDAERQLQQAKRELERVLRQLREEEIKRSLASLESRFRRMLEMEMKIYDDTLSLDNARDSSPLDELEIQSGKLAVRQRGLVTDAARALLVLEDDGTSIAIAETVRQAQADMQQAAERLTSAKTGAITQEIQQSVIETLGYLVEVFEEAKNEAENQQSPNQAGDKKRPGEQALVNELAELKLIRGLQQQILRRHSRYAELLTDPNDLVGSAGTPAIRSALDNLSQRQESLQQITQDIVVGKNR